MIHQTTLFEIFNAPFYGSVFSCPIDIFRVVARPFEDWSIQQASSPMLAPLVEQRTRRTRNVEIF
ncbi:hypothetical protein EBZ70_04945 [bacterium]|nr:hypothetical protein [bacterium]